MGVGIIVCGLNGSGKAFFDMVGNRAEDYAANWAQSLACQIIEIDGPRAIGESVKLITEQMRI